MHRGLNSCLSPPLNAIGTSKSDSDFSLDFVPRCTTQDPVRGSISQGWVVIEELWTSQPGRFAPESCSSENREWIQGRQGRAKQWNPYSWKKPPCPPCPWQVFSSQPLWLLIANSSDDKLYWPGIFQDILQWQSNVYLHHNLQITMDFDWARFHKWMLAKAWVWCNGATLSSLRCER